MASNILFLLPLMGASLIVLGRAASARPVKVSARRGVRR